MRINKNGNNSKENVTYIEHGNEIFIVISRNKSINKYYNAVNDCFDNYFFIIHFSYLPF